MIFFNSKRLHSAVAVTIVCILVQLGLRGSVAAQEKAVTTKTSIPFSSYYHGRFADADQIAITVTPAFIATAQEYYLNTVGVIFNDSRLDTYRKIDAELFRTGAINTLDSTKVRAVILRSWISEAEKRKLRKYSQIKQWKQHSGALRQAIPIAFKTLIKSKDELAAFNRLSAKSAGLMSAAFWQYQASWLGSFNYLNLQIIVTSELFPDSSDYNAQCQAEGVPIPPDWGDSAWKYQGELEDEFIMSREEALVYAYSSPLGTCIALPRKRDGLFSSPFISNFGIICQGAQTENACFWDKRSSTLMEDFNSHVSLDEFGGAGDGDIEECTVCHAGENAFIIHPDTPLDLNPHHYDISATWYKPIVPDSWPQNPGPIALSSDTSYTTRNIWGQATTHRGSSCTGCHALPDFRYDGMARDFCDSVLTPAANITMPPRRSDSAEHPAGWPGFFDLDSDYRVHLDRLKALCE